MTAKKTAIHAKTEKQSKEIKGCGRGGRREGAGRKPGSRNKTTIELQSAAKAHAPAALETLVRLSKSAQSEAVQCTAAQAILDRAHGRPRQAVDVNPEGVASLALTVSAARERLAAKLDRICSTSEASAAAIEHEPTAGKPH